MFYPFVPHVKKKKTTISAPTCCPQHVFTQAEAWVARMNAEADAKAEKRQCQPRIASRVTPLRANRKHTYIWVNYNDLTVLPHWNPG